MPTVFLPSMLREAAASTVSPASSRAKRSLSPALASGSKDGAGRAAL